MDYEYEEMMRMPTRATAAYLSLGVANKNATKKWRLAVISYCSLLEFNNIKLNIWINVGIVINPFDSKAK